jgi:hypothetical protein
MAKNGAAIYPRYDCFIFPVKVVSTKSEQKLILVTFYSGKLLQEQLREYPVMLTRRYLTTVSSPRGIYLYSPSYLVTLSLGYRAVPDRFWRVGRVFIMVWRHPQRAGAQNYSHINKTLPGEDTVIEMRRFVVIRVNFGNCLCL